MRHRAAVPLLVLLGALGTAPRAAPAAAPSIFVSYSFEDDLATGPDTFAIYRYGKGHVRLSQAFHLSGYRSLELRDVKGDQAFPELQGYFPEQRTGRLYFHFAFLVANPLEELNVALAGPRWFQPEKDGIAFWLGTRAGQLVHVAGHEEKKLLAVEPFVWYAVDVAYDLDRGRYDLGVLREGQAEPLVALRDQPNTAGRPGSAVDKFSFVGAPFTDTSNVDYFVDDVVISSDQPAARPPFVAPGRRRLFVDLFLAYRERLLSRRCLPPRDAEELGLAAADGARLGSDAHRADFLRLLAGEPVDAAALSGGADPPALAALFAWSAGCRALESGDAATAQARFAAAAAAAPDSFLYRVSSVLALAAGGRFAEADEALAALAASSEDPRYAAASAFVGRARGDLQRAESWLRDPAARALDTRANPLLLAQQRGFTADVLRALRGQLGGDAFRVHLEETLLTEQYFYVLLWQEQYEAARDYARRMGSRLAAAGVAPTPWAERAGDACLLVRDLEGARAAYGQAILAEKDFGALRVLYLKLADVAHLAGDAATERRFREHYYGALTE